MLAGWTGSRGGRRRRAHGSVIVQVPSAAVLPGIVRQLDDSGIELAEFSLRKSSLDEVFLDPDRAPGRGRADAAEQAALPLTRRRR